ncbi:MAG TPA: thioesterase domain-containing protein [Ktedonobacteraceae bacterium]|nr:thioesterase domain-containing protein [Chthonomonadales bacterium]HEV2580652.1 thioesterase domain-containing protein [Ktedonobacteraceae bacterium]
MPELSDAKRALLEKYLRGELSTQADTRDTAPPEAQAESTGPRVVPIQARGSKRPFFFLHGQWQSMAFYCFPLAQGLGSDQPFYVVEPFTFEQQPVPPSFQEIAAIHIKAIRAVQPEGPYLLSGWCNGALMAYEIARQLHEAGQQVDLLVLMNSMALVYPRRYHMTRHALVLLGKLLRSGEEKQIDWYVRIRRARLYFLHVKDYFRIRIRKLQAALHLGTAEQIERWGQRSVTFPRPSEWLPKAGTLRQDYESVFTWLTLGYKPPRLYPGKITFFWSSADWSAKEPFRNGWLHVEKTQNVEIHVIPGKHMGLVTDQLPTLVETLRACLDTTRD